jgi:excisionase family DNA binding protein
MFAKTELTTMKIEETAQVLGIGRQTAYDLANEGKLLGAIRLGKRWVVSRKALEEVLSGHNDRD